MRIAIVQDELVRKGGSERVALYLHYAFPEAPIYTLAYRPELTYPEFNHCTIISSWIQSVVVNERALKRIFFPLGIMAMQQLDVTNFDIVLMSSTHCAKYVRIDKNALVINFCHCPFRLAWNPESYAEYAEGTGLKKWGLKQVIGILKKIDYKAAQRVNYYIANTSYMAAKIKNDYNHDKNIQVINPPTECKNFYISQTIDEYYLVVSRLEHYKRIDLAVEAFNILQRPLIVVGRGTHREKLMQMAGSNIVFEDLVTEKQLAKLYSRCKALIFPQEEDYGITPLEANASGRPVIALSRGGVLETMIPYDKDKNKATSLFFHNQTVHALVDAVRFFESITFDSARIRENALKYDVPSFIRRIRAFVHAKIQEK